MLVAPPRCDDHWKYRVDDGKHLVTVIDIATGPRRTIPAAPEDRQCAGGSTTLSDAARS